MRGRLPAAETILYQRKLLVIYSMEMSKSYHKSYHKLVDLSAKMDNNPFSVENFISTDEHQVLCNLYDELPVYAPATHNRATRKDYLMFDENIKTTQEIFLPKLQALWPDKEIVVDGGNFTEWHLPVSPHTDNYQLQYKDKPVIEENQEVSSYAVIVPLRTNTNKGQPNTVFFNQRFHGHSIICGVDPGLENMIGYTNCPFDKNNEYYPLLDFVPDDRLFGLSVECVIPWVFRSAIVWPRSQVHCATKFQGYDSKLHLVFLINFKT